MVRLLKQKFPESVENQKKYVLIEFFNKILENLVSFSRVRWFLSLQCDKNPEQRARDEIFLYSHVNPY